MGLCAHLLVTCTGGVEKEKEQKQLLILYSILMGVEWCTQPMFGYSCLH